ncbi:hypothetical protein J6590_073172 [Homalodisca vitripennis]|nr:hypothetical protein J6590_073172 [Homalodisca vitripennis]
MFTLVLGVVKHDLSISPFVTCFPSCFKLPDWKRELPISQLSWLHPPSPQVDHPLWWTILWWTIFSGGLFSLVDNPIWWTIPSGGPSTLVVHPLRWTIISGGPSSLVDHHLRWTVISGGPSSPVDHPLW